MLSFSKLKIFIILSVCFISFYFAAPSFLSQNSDSKMSKFFPKDRINLGLDLQGGSQLTLEIDFDYYLKEQVLNLREEIKNSFREEYVQALPEAQGDKILISIMVEEQKSLAKKHKRVEKARRLFENYNIYQKSNKKPKACISLLDEKLKDSYNISASESTIRRWVKKFTENSEQPFDK